MQLPQKEEAKYPRGEQVPYPCINGGFLDGEDHQFFNQGFSFYLS